MYDRYRHHLAQALSEIQDAGLTKKERVIDSPQGAWVRLRDGTTVLNLCANNYLGLAAHPDIVRAASEAVKRWGHGLASVRFICGTQTQHKELEERISEFLGTEDTILYGSCFDANGGLFETLLGEQDAVISDALNHASIIDGVRLCKAQRLRYANNSMEELERCLEESRGARFRMIATDGVFSMDGYLANLPGVCALAEKHDALVMVDDSHATGFVGATGRGTPERHAVRAKVDVLTGTLGKALGGASGGYTSGRKEIIDYLRQRSRPYLFSNTLPPSVTGAALEALRMLSRSTELRDKLEDNTRYFREGIRQLGLPALPGEHPIVPIMLGDAHVAGAFAEKMLARGVYVVSFSYPVVPKEKARIRTQMSAAHSRSDLDRALDAFAGTAKELGL